MYKPKFEALIADEQIKMDELPTNIIREIKAIRMQIKTVQELPEEDEKFQEMITHDDKICDLINSWLDAVVETPTPVVTPTENIESTQTPPVTKDTPPVNTVAPAASTDTPPVVEKTEIVEKKTEDSNNNDDAVIAKIKAGLSGKRIHEKQLIEILGSKPNRPIHKLNGMTLKRVWMGDGLYEVV